MESNEISRLLKYYRAMRNMSQKDLSEASGIGIDLIKKYELNSRKPKIEQINKIADALNVSPNAFIDNNIKNIGDIMAYIMALDEQTSLTISCAKDGSGNYLPDTLSFSFRDPIINRRIVDYLNFKDSEDS